MSSKKNKTREVPATASQFMAPDCEPMVVKEKAFTLTPYSGQQFAHWYWGKMAFEMSGMTLRKPVIPALVDHDSGEIAGQIDSLKNDGGKIELSGSFLETDCASEVIATQKIGWECSLAFDMASAVIEEVGANAKTTVNGQEFSGPGVIVRKCQLHECSFTYFGAVPGAAASFSQQMVPVSVFFQEAAMADPIEVSKAADAARAETLANFKRFTQLCPENPAFVAEQFAKGASVEAFLVELSARRAAKIAELQKPPVGAQPASFSGTGDAPATPATPEKGFIELSRDLAKAESLTLRDAMSKLARTQPELYAKHVESAPVQKVTKV